MSRAFNSAASPGGNVQARADEFELQAGRNGIGRQARTGIGMPYDPFTEQAAQIELFDV